MNLILCEIKLLLNKDKQIYTFTDINTNYPIVINEGDLKSVNAMVKSRAEQQNTVPHSFVFLCDCYVKNKIVYITYIHSMSIIDIHTNKCYLEFTDEDIIIKDLYTDKIILFENMPDEAIEDFKKYIILLSIKQNLDFTYDGNARLILIGKLLDMNTEYITYDFNEILMMDFANIVMNNLYQITIN